MKQRRKHWIGWIPFLAKSILLIFAISTALLLLRISKNAINPTGEHILLSSLSGDDFEAFDESPPGIPVEEPDEDEEDAAKEADQVPAGGPNHPRPCATVEEMGEVFAAGSEKESLRIREVIKRHFDLHGAARVRGLAPHQFCQEGFVIGKASEAGFGNEMYKILTAAALSVMLNRSLIIGQTRGLYPFGDYISYTNLSFTLKEVKHLWRKNDCAGQYGRNLIMRVDNFEKPAETNVLCSDWRVWKQPIIWFQGTTDAVAIQFFLKNVHPGMRNVASILFGKPGSLQPRPNVFGELMRVLISPSQAIKEAVHWVLKGADPDISLHMRMLTNRSARAVKAALQCIRRAILTYQNDIPRPRVVVVSDTPSFIKEIRPNLTEFAEVLHFNYKLFEGDVSGEKLNKQHKSIEFRTKDWGPAPRWVAFVDFFLASRAKHAIVSGAHRRVGTTYAQLLAALASANQHGEESSPSSNFSFFSSFQSNLLVEGLGNQAGWGHVWNRFAGPLSCRHQPHQCAFTPLLPAAWWDGPLQSPIPRDIRRLQAYGIGLTETGEVIESSLESHCHSRKDHVKKFHVFGQCNGPKCT